ncbi:hypothetical protein [Paenibacillus alkaliterrae]
MPAILESLAVPEVLEAIGAIGAIEVLEDPEEAKMPFKITP